MEPRLARTTLFVLISTFAGAAGAAEAARITGVVLYPGSATIERAARVTMGGGKLEMSGLPANFDARTLRVDADSGIVVGEISVRDTGRTEAMSGREAELEARIQALKDQLAALDVEVKTAELVRDYLTGLSTRPAGEGEKRPLAVDPKAIPALIEAIQRGGTGAYGTIQRIAVKKRDITKTMAALERDLAQLRSGTRDARTLTISYSAARPGELRAAYQVANAGWRPAYRAALDSGASRLDLERQATVVQRTGEDWRGVKLRLSTGQPRAAQLVDPNTWQLVIRSPEPKAMADMASGVARQEARSRLAAAPARPDEKEAAVVAQLETQYASEFDVPGRVDVVSDGRQVTVSLATQPIAVKQRIRVVPRRDSAAMVTAEADLPEGVWIPGEVQLYRDGSYVGSTYWQAQAKEKLVLPFGVDDRVQVATRRIKDRSGSAGLLAQRSERQVATLYTITSRHKVPVELLVLESAPVAVNDQISVATAFEPKPKATDWDERRGVAAWEQPLAPGQTLKFVADYTITYPKDAAVIGLP